jgi:2-oxoglutarate ferredoxin oxidoreductase subunit gamma
VIIADEEIGSPSVRNPSAVLVFNLPSLDKYEPMVKSGGVLIVNASLINRELNRTDLKAIKIPANEIAESIGSKRLTNMVMLGALISQLPVLSIQQLETGLDNHIPGHHRDLLEMNYQALREGSLFFKIGAGAT